MRNIHQLREQSRQQQQRFGHLVSILLNFVTLRLRSRLLMYPTRLETLSRDKRLLILLLLSVTKKSIFMTSTVGPCTVKHYAFVMYVFLSKLACLSKSVIVTDSKRTPAYCVICSFPCIANPYCFIVKAPGACIIKLITAVIYGFP